MERKITDEIYKIGVYDDKLDLFEGHYQIPNGVTYNSYLIKGEKNIVVDAVEKDFVDDWLNNIKEILGDSEVDYLIVQHMEPDHSAGVEKFLEQYPNAKVVGNMMTFNMLEQYFPNKNFNDNKIHIKDNDELKIGECELKFVFAPMVHWPEVFFTYDKKSKTLFSADAFGRFGKDNDSLWENEARRYYFGIVGKYGMQVQKALEKLSNLEIARICPLHGSILENDLSKYIQKYDLWSKYLPEKKGVTIAFTSVYGHTKQAVEILSEELKNYNIECEIFDLCRCEKSYALASAFKFSNLVLATTTYNMDIFPDMRDFVESLNLRNFQNRNIAIIENGTWAPNAKNIILPLLKNFNNISENNITIKSNLSADNLQGIKNLAYDIKNQLN